jgi:hypothetical protein
MSTDYTGKEIPKESLGPEILALMGILAGLVWIAYLYHENRPNFF